MLQHDGRICDEGLGEKAVVRSQFQIEFVATTTEEIGNPVYSPARHKLEEHSIDCAGKTAAYDYDKYDLLIGMDRVNLRTMRHICAAATSTAI